MPSVDVLRQQLRERGYLTHGIERWFALDPWSSRTFWVELAVVAWKAALLIALFGVLPPSAVMLFRNHPLSPLEIAALALIYGATWMAVVFAFIVLVALVLKLRPALAVDTPRALLVISLAASALLTLLVVLWWSRFAAPPSLPELVTGVALTILFFLIATIVVSAALLSFSIYELKRVPALHQRSRTKPLTVAAVVLLALLFIPAQEKASEHEPVQVVTTPVARRLALVAVDGLTYEIFTSRADLAAALPNVQSIATIDGASTTERWASAGTGVPTRIHGVRAIEGIRFRGGSHILQSISDADLPIRTLGTRQPLPPTVRRRDFVWELFAHRGMPVLAVNWWTSSEGVTQQQVFAQAKGDALAVDAIAAKQLLSKADHAQFVTVYLPALDVILNRLPLDRSAQLTQSVRALDHLAQTIAALKTLGYEVLVIGMPGDHQTGRAVLASGINLARGTSAFDLAPTLCALLGFPAATEMPGKSLAGDVTRIPTYGNRIGSAPASKVDEEYYENLKSLGYIR